MTTLHVDLGPEWRGGQQQALLLMRGLRARQHEAELIARESAPLATRARAEGIRVHPIGRRLPRLRAVFRLRESLRHGEFDILHAHDAHALAAAWLAGAHRRTSLVASRRVVYPLSSSWSARAHYRAARRVLAVSRFAAENVIQSRLPPERVQVVYDGIEVPPLPSPEARAQARRHWGAAQEETLLGCVGSLVPEKGQEILVRALPALLAQFPRCRLLLAGDGPCRSRLERLGRELGVEAALHFAGFVEEVAVVYAALDAFLFPSLTEGLGSALLTAMAYALPVVALGRGAAPEVVEDGRTGLLLPAPEPAAVAAAVARLIAEPRQARRMGAAARETIQQRFTADQMVENTLSVYREVCSQKGDR